MNMYTQYEVVVIVPWEADLRCPIEDDPNPSILGLGLKEIDTGLDHSWTFEVESSDPAKPPALIEKAKEYMKGFYEGDY